MPALRRGDWTLLEVAGWPDNPTHRDVLAWAWHDDRSHHLVAVNLARHTARRAASRCRGTRCAAGRGGSPTCSTAASTTATATSSRAPACTSTCPRGLPTSRGGANLTCSDDCPRDAGNGKYLCVSDAREPGRLIDFERVDVISLMIYPPRPTLVVSGRSPTPDTEVTLVPLTYVSRPQYHGIQVVGTLTDAAPADGSGEYSVQLDLVGCTGTEGVEVIGASRTARLSVPSASPEPPTTTEGG